MASHMSVNCHVLFLYVVCAWIVHVKCTRNGLDLSPTRRENVVEMENGDADNHHRGVSFGYTLGKTSCPKRCNCSHEMKTRLLHVDCSHQRLQQIPTIPTNALTLNLKENRLIIITEDAFSKPSHLVSLDLSRNSIRKLEINCFRGLSKLESLFLTSNNLKYIGSLASDVFKPLLRLSTLHVAGNCKSDGECQSLVNEVTKVSTLIELHIDGYKGLKFHQSFGNLTKLNRLGFGGYHGQCDLDNMSNHTFETLSEVPIIWLGLSDCGIKHVSAGVLSPIKSLRQLDISGNRDLCHGGWRNITTGLHRIDIQSIDCQYNCNFWPNNHTVSVFDLEPLHKTKLKSLSLTHCNLQYIEPMVITNAIPVTITELRLDDNDLNYPYFAIFLPLLRNLEILDISVQSNYKSSVLLQNLVTPALIKRGFATTPMKSNLSLDTHKYSNHYTNDIKAVANLTASKYFGSGCDIKLPILNIPRKLRVFNSSYIHLPYPIPNMTFDSDNSLEVVDGSHCLFPSICGKIIGLNKLKCLNLSQNKINYINYEVFSEMPMLEDLNLSGNGFGDIFEIAQSHLLFHNNSELKVLDMSSCKIKILPKMIFSTLTKLQILKLKDNSLETVDFDVEGMLQSLRLLDVSHNNIKSIPEITTKMLDIMAAGFVINLSGNQLKCDCADLSFTKWLSKTKVVTFVSGSHFVNYKNKHHRKLTCKIANGTRMHLDNLKEIEDELALECVTWIVVTACVSYMLVSLLVLSLIAVMYRQRWKLRYLYYTSVKRVNPYISLENERENINDVYLSFDEDHVLTDGSRLYHVISRNVLDALKARGFRAKIREELDAGKSLRSLISNAIQESNKTVVFLSRDYCVDFWNTFEFNMALCDGMFTHCKVVVPVLVEDVDFSNFVPEIRTYLQEEKVLKFSLAHFDDFIEHLCHKISQ